MTTTKTIKGQVIGNKNEQVSAIPT